MLHRIISQFLDYCRLAEFSVRSLQALAIRTNEFEAFLIILKIRSATSARNPGRGIRDVHL